MSSSAYYIFSLKSYFSFSSHLLFVLRPFRSKALETEFEKNKYLSVSKRLQLSKQLKLTETQVSSPFRLQGITIIKTIKDHRNTG